MDVLGTPGLAGHEQVTFFSDPKSGLRAIVAIHDTTLGPAIGGCRMWPYASEGAALCDVLRLASGMTYKAAMARVPFGGGKTVVIGDPRQDKSEALLRALGRAIEGLGGRYYTGEDVGTSPADMDLVGEETAYALGRSRGGSGDPSPLTARGVWIGIKAAVRHRLKREDLQGIRVAIQGLGHVGYALARLLRQDGAELIVADLDPMRADRAAFEFKARVVAPEAVMGVEAEVLAPCALGGVINDLTVPFLNCAIVAGAANNQLLEARHGAALRARSILYAPDYVINAGGVINIAQELHPAGYDRQRALAQVNGIGSTLREIFERADQERLPTDQIADRMAEDRLGAARQARALATRAGQEAVVPARRAAVAG
jgi:leucine dehydrogenase